MATGGETGRAREHSSDVVQHYTCSMCSKSGKTTEASHYCPDCDGCYCKACLCDHVVIGRSKVEQWGKGVRAACKEGDQPEEVKCLRHPEHKVELYCEDHDVVCCRMCPSAEHRTCVNVKGLQTVVDDQKLDTDRQVVKNEIINLQKQAAWLKKESKIRQKCTEMSHDNYINQLHAFKRKVDTSFDDLEQDTNQLRRYHVGKCSADQVLCEAIEKGIPKFEQMLQPNDDKLKDFVHKKVCKEWVTQNNKRMSELNDAELKERFEPFSEANVDYALNVLKDKGKCNIGRTKIAVSISGDDCECVIVGICQIANGNTVLADRANKNLKQFDGVYTATTHYILNESPQDVCAIGGAEVAVAMENKKVLIVAVGTAFQIVRSLDMDHICSQITCHNDHMYITDTSTCRKPCTCRTKIHVYDKSGNAVKGFGTGDNCQTLIGGTHSFGWFSSAQRLIATSHKGQSLYIACPNAGLISLDLQGNKLTESSDFSDIMGLCVGECGYLYISKSSEVIKLSQTGTECFKAIKTVRQLNFGHPPKAICYDRHLGRVVICPERGNYIYLV